MTIQAYTFESANVDGSQITPYSAKVDARVRRDMFHGEGNLIIPGNGNGLLNPNGGTSNGSTYTTTIPDTITFIAGGRLFTMSETVDLYLSTTSVPVIYTSELVFDINTKDANGEYVKLVDFPTYNTDPEAWESDTFSVVYSLVVAVLGSEVYVYPAYKHNGKVSAGSTVNLNAVGLKIETGASAGWRGAVFTQPAGEEIYVAKTGRNFTISGVVKSFVSVSDGVEFGTHGNTPDYIEVEDGYVTIFTKNWIGIGELSHTMNAGRQNSRDLKISNITTVFGVKPSGTFSGGIIGNFTGQWATA